MNRQLKHREIQQDRGHARPNETVLLLDGVVKAENIAMISRLADACGIEEICMLRSWPSSWDKIERYSRSSSRNINWRRLERWEEVEKLFPRVTTVAVEYTTESIPYYEVNVDHPCIWIFGSEKYGIGQDVLDRVDATVHIPMLGQNSSLNVACAAAAVVLDQIYRGRS